MWTIEEITPAPWGDNHRHVVSVETKEDAEKVLKTLYEVDVLCQNLYRIVKWPRTIESSP